MNRRVYVEYQVSSTFGNASPVHIARVVRETKEGTKTEVVVLAEVRHAQKDATRRGAIEAAIDALRDDVDAAREASHGLIAMEQA